MFLLRSCILMTLTLCAMVIATDDELRQQLQIIADQVEFMKSKHQTDISNLNREIADLKENAMVHQTDNHERNERVALEWAQTSMGEVRAQMREMAESINNSALLKHLHTIRNELKQVLMENKDLSRLARTHETRIDKLDNEVSRIKYEATQMKKNQVELRSMFIKLSKEVKKRQIDQITPEANEVLGNEKQNHGHKIRHNKMVHAQISRLAKTQEQIDEYQQSLQNQLLDAQRRLDRLEENNWNLISAKVDYLEVDSKIMRDQFNNLTQKVSDFDKVHASLLELREDIEGVENKADKIIPEIKKEISKLDVSVVQINAGMSYLKADQESLHQTVKAIAVSVSNAIDRAELDRLTISRLNESIVELRTSSKKHFYRLNDHILKSEANVPTTETVNNSVIVPLPELMGEVRELIPVEHEYQDLVKQLPRDCTSITSTGVYLIHPTAKPIETWCANGTTLVQRRYNGTVEFNNNYNQYVKGFGNAASEYWLGLEALHVLTADNCTGMMIDMTDIYGGNWYAKYDYFNIGSADTGYVLNVGGFTGNASDAFEYQNRMKFSTIDNDKDISNTHCAANYEGGWWYSHCQHVNINGKYSLGLTWFDSIRNEWIAITTSEMRIFKRKRCN